MTYLINIVISLKLILISSIFFYFIIIFKSNSNDYYRTVDLIPITDSGTFESTLSLNNKINYMALSYYPSSQKNNALLFEYIKKESDIEKTINDT